MTFFLFIALWRIEEYHTVPYLLLANRSPKLGLLFEGISIYETSLKMHLYIPDQVQINSYLMADFHVPFL